MSLLKFTAVATGAAMLGNYLGTTYVVPHVPSVPSVIVTGGVQLALIYVALRFTHAK